MADSRDLLLIHAVPLSGIQPAAELQPILQSRFPDCTVGIWNADAQTVAPGRPGFWRWLASALCFLLFAGLAILLYRFNGKRLRLGLGAAAASHRLEELFQANLVFSAAPAGHGFASRLVWIVWYAELWLFAHVGNRPVFLLEPAHTSGGLALAGLARVIRIRSADGEAWAQAGAEKYAAWKQMGTGSPAPWVQSVVVQNLFGRLSGAIASQGLSAVTLLLTARTLGPALYGQYAGAASLLSLTSVIFSLGLNTWLLREGGRRPAQMAESLGSVLTIKTTLGLVWFMGVAWLAPLWTDPQELPVPVILLSASVILLDGLFQTLISGLKATLRNWSTLLLEGGADAAWMLLTVAIVAAGVLQLPPYFIVRLFTLAVGSLLGLWYVRRVIGLRSQRQAISGVLSEAGPFATAELLTALAARADVTIVMLMLGSLAAGKYSPAVGLVNMLFILPISIYTVLLPVLTRHYVRDQVRAQSLARRSIWLYFGMGVGLCAAFWLLAPSAVLVLGKRYQDTVELMRILALVLFFRSLSTGYATSLLARGRQKDKAAVQAVAVVAAVALNLVIVRPFGLTGVAWVYVFSEVILALGFAWRSGIYTRKSLQI